MKFDEDALAAYADALPVVIVDKFEEAFQEAIEDEHEARASQLYERLVHLSKDPVAMARLHPIEREILDELLKEDRHLRCEGCRHWVSLFLKKMEPKENG